MAALLDIMTTPTVACIVTFLIAALGYALWALVVVPLQYAAFYRAQGLSGTPFTFLLGDILLLRRLLATTPEPFLDAPRRFIELSGNIGFSWLGPSIRLRVYDAPLLRELLVTHSYKFPKSDSARASECCPLG